MKIHKILKLITIACLLPKMELAQAFTPNNVVEERKTPFVNPIDLNELLPTLKSSNINEKSLNFITWGHIAFEAKNYDDAERQWIVVLNDKDLPDDARKAVLQNLAHLYVVTEDTGKEILLYEKYVETFKEDPSASYILFELGNFYRKKGIINLALERYYAILECALFVPQAELSSYRAMLSKVKIAIAETYFEMNNLPEALRLFSRLQLDNTPLEVRRRVLFEKIRCQYQLKRYPEALAALEQFCDDNINDPYSAEALFLKIKTLKALNRREETISITLELLKTAKKHRQSQDPHWEQWDYWQKEAAKQIAKEFYDEQKYVDALTIYQAMVGMDTTPSWQWPILHAIGLCYERLHLLQKAEAAYQIISNVKDAWNQQPLHWSELLKAYQEDCQWRLKQLKQYTESQSAINKLLQAK